MMNNSSLILTAIAAALGGGFFGYLFGRFTRWREMIKERAQAVKKSRAAVLGEVNEKVAPLLPDFPWRAKDLTFVGKGFDYLVLDGISEGTVREVIFLEVKTGKSTPNANEKSLRDALKAGKVSWKEYRM